ncbi:MAG: electron transfer flavoprotein subunit beta/FixA family protein, partial [Bacilli bacterium]
DFKVKNKIEMNITSYTMGILKAQAILEYSFELGVDNAYLISDKVFAGADTYATAKVLSKALQQHNYDLIICGRSSSDGDTSQVGPGIAAFINYPHLFNVKRIMAMNEETIIVEQEIDDIIVQVEAPYPLLLVIDSLQSELKPTLAHKLKAKHKPITILDHQQLAFKASEVGNLGSLTQVSKVVYLNQSNQNITISGNLDQALKHVMEEIYE